MCAGSGFWGACRILSFRLHFVTWANTACPSVAKENDGGLFATGGAAEAQARRAKTASSAAGRKAPAMVGAVR